MLATHLRSLKQLRYPSYFSRKHVSSNLHHLFNNKNAALLTNLPPTINQPTLVEKLQKLDKKDVHLQPGCSIHFLKEDHAKISSSYLSSKHGLKANIRTVPIPKLLLTNLEETIDSKAVGEAFSKFDPVAVEGVRSLQASRKVLLRFQGSDVTLPTLKDLINLDEGNTTFKTAELKRIKKPAIFIRNIEDLEDEEIATFCDTLNPWRMQLLKETEDGYNKVAVLYFRSEEEALSLLEKTDATINDSKVSLSYRDVTEPCIVLHNLPSDITEDDLQEAYSGYDFIRVNVENAENGSSATIVVKSPKEQRILLRILDGAVIGGRTITATADEIYDIGIEIESDESYQFEFWQALAKWQLREVKSFTGNDCTVTFAESSKARLALHAFLKGTIAITSQKQGHTVATLGSTNSFAVEVEGFDVNKPVSALLSDLNQQNPELSIIATNRNALVRFRRARNVVQGMKFLRGVQFGNEKCKVERYRPHPQNYGSEYDQEQSDEAFDRYSSQVTYKDDLMSDSASRYKLLKNEFDRALFDALSRYSANRDGSGKYKGEKKSKKAKKTPKVNLEAEGEEEEDDEEGEEDEDEELLFIDDSLPPSVRIEAETLIESLHDDPGSAKSLVMRSRLFQIFIQQKNYRKFSADFKELETVLGTENEEDPFRWNNFRLENDEDAEAIEEKRLKARFFKELPPSDERWDQRMVEDVNESQNDDLEIEEENEESNDDDWMEGSNESEEENESLAEDEEEQEGEYVYEDVNESQNDDLEIEEENEESNDDDWMEGSNESEEENDFNESQNDDLGIEEENEESNDDDWMEGSNESEEENESLTEDEEEQEGEYCV